MAASLQMPSPDLTYRLIPGSSAEFIGITTQLDEQTLHPAEASITAQKERNYS
jgi:hypothetical protein